MPVEGHSDWRDPRVHGGNVRIYLSTEGTYPFVLGGVSTWVDMLVHGLPDHNFEIGALD